jgi:hypothetical protein
MAGGATRGARNRRRSTAPKQVRTNDLKQQIELDVRLALDSLRSADQTR